MKRVIVILLVVLLVAGGGAGGLIMLGIVPNPFSPPEVYLTDAEKAALAVTKTKFKPPMAAYVLVKMPDMTVPVIIDGQVRRRVFLTVRLMASGAGDKAALEEGVQRYQNAVIGDLFPFFQTYYLKNDVLDLQLIKAKLLKHAKAVYGEDAVRDALLINVFDQAGK